MSRASLQSTLAAIPPGVADLSTAQAIGAAIGPKLGKNEKAQLSSFMDDRYDRMDAGTRRVFEGLIGRPSAARTPRSFEVRGRYFTGIDEQSALTFVSPQHGFLAIDDATGKVWNFARPAQGQVNVETRVVLDDAKNLKGLEGAFFDRERSALLVVSEDSREVHELSVDTSRGELSVGKPKLLGKLPKLGTRSNKGFEGIAVLPSTQTPDGRARILAVNEADPKGIGIFHRDSLKQEAFVTLPKALDKAIIDLSDITVDPKSGHIFLLSDESRSVHEIDLVPVHAFLGVRTPASDAKSWRMVPLGSTELPASTNKNRLQPEGLAFDDRGHLWIASEGDQSLLELSPKN